MSVKPYKINVPQAKIDRLKAKLALADFPDELDDAAWDYGAPLVDVKRFTKYWQEKFDWRAAEAKLNEMPQFTATVQIDGFDPIELHFVHAKSSVPGAIPLLFVHGWPGSFNEVSKILPELVKGGDGHPAFDVVAPSLPGFGFSSRPKQRGFFSKQIAMAFQKLMVDVLGYKEYVTQGGDVGYSVTRWVGWLYSDHVKASHYNMPRPEKPDPKHYPKLAAEYENSERTQAELDGFTRMKWFNEESFGYNLEQSTKPQTLGYSLTDSPVGLLAWIYEKMHDWSDNYPWTEDEVCKWISIYYFSTSGPTASLHNYYETAHAKDPDIAAARSGYLPHVKIGVTKYPRELFVYPQSWNQTLGDLVFDKVYDHGGHFAAYETPELMVSDLREMFGKNGGAYGVVTGRSGC